MPSPIRANFLFLLLILSLWLIAPYMQHFFGLTGLVVTEVLVFLLLPVAIARAAEKHSIREVFRLRMLSLAGIVKAALLGFTAWMTGQSVAVVAIYIVHRLGGEMPDMYASLLNAPLWLALLVGALVPAICEEVSFRGYVQWGLGPLGARTAVILTGLFFGVMHLSLIRLIPLALLGVIFSAAVQRSGSLLTGIIMHLVNNSTALVLAFLAKSKLGAVPQVTEITTAAVGSWLILGLGAGLATWGLIRSLGDAGEPDTAVQEGERLPLGAEFLPVIPALLLFASYTRFELFRVFGGR